jgi:hypothetical protein
MVRRKDRPLLQVHVSFEATRLGSQHLIAAYTNLVPTVRRKSPQSIRDDAATAPTIITTKAAGGET